MLPGWHEILDISRWTQPSFQLGFPFPHFSHVESRTLWLSNIFWMGGILCHLEGDKEVGLVTVSWWPWRHSELYLLRFGVSVTRPMCERSEGSPMSPPPWMFFNRGNQRKDSKCVWSELVNPGHAFLSWSVFLPLTHVSLAQTHANVEHYFAKRDTTYHLHHIVKPNGPTA